MVFTLKSSQILQFSVLFGVSIAARVSGTTVCRIIATRRLIFVTAHSGFEIWIIEKKNVPGITLLPNSSTTFSVSENQRVKRLKENGGSKNGNLGLKKIFADDF